MNPARRYLRQPRRRRRLLWRAAWHVLAARLQTHDGPRTLRQVGKTDGDTDPALAAELGWAVRHAARLVPGARCLAQALAAAHMLQRRGLRSEVVIGARRSPDGALEAHAWTLHDGTPIVGGALDGRDYQRLERDKN